MIGHGALFEAMEMTPDTDVREVQNMFSTVGASMFTLFEIMSGWSLANLSPLLEAMPFLKPAFVVFIIYTSWALLSVMTGVVSENMIAIREQMDSENREV